MSKKGLKILIFRLFALMFAFGVVYSVQNPASAIELNVTPGAVRPQQGWYVRGTMKSSASGTSREYFIIDTKMTADPWYVEMQSTVFNFDVPYFSYDAATGQSVHLYSQFYPYTYWQGYSQIDWVVDSDWLILLEWDGIEADNTTLFSVNFWDASNSLMFVSTDIDDSKVGYISDIFGELPFLTGPSRSNNSTISVGNPGQGYQVSYTPASVTALLDYVIWGSANPFSIYGYRPSNTPVGGNWYQGGVSINDLCFCIFPMNITDKSNVFDQASVYGRVAISFAIPVDKAPAGTQVGDSWPKVQPLPVQIQGSLDDYKAWKDNALAQTPVADAADVTSQIEGYNQQLDAADEWGTLETNAWNEIVPILDSFDFVFTILGIAAVVFVLLLFIKKGMA